MGFGESSYLPFPLFLLIEKEQCGSVAQRLVVLPSFRAVPSKTKALRKRASCQVYFYSLSQLPHWVLQSCSGPLAASIVG